MSTILYFGMNPEECDILEKEMGEEKGYTMKLVPTAEDFLNPATYEGADIVLDGNPNQKLTEEYFAMLEACGIRYMVLRMTGVGQCDFEAATRHHVRIANVQNYSPNAISELTLALALSLNRNLFVITDSTKNCDFSIRVPHFKEIRDCTVGVLGVGHIGSTTAKMFADLGARVLGYDAYPYEPNKAFMTYTDPETIAKESDIICVHLPYIEGVNYHFVGEEFLSKVKKEVLIVNAARGELVDLAAMNKAVKEDRVQAYATDVIEKEASILRHTPEEITDETIKEAVALYPRIIVVPHLGAWTSRAKRAMIDISMEELISFLNDGTAKYWLNREA